MSEPKQRWWAVENFVVAYILALFVGLLGAGIWQALKGEMFLLLLWGTITTMVWFGLVGPGLERERKWREELERWRRGD